MDTVKTNTTKLFLVITALFAVFFIADLLLPLGVAGGVPYVAVVLVTMWLSDVRYLIAVGIISTLLTVTGYFLSNPNSEFWIVVTNRFLAVSVIWATVLFAAWHRRFTVSMIRKESLYRILFESAIEPVMIVNKEGVIIEANDTTIRLFGYERDELIGQKIELLMPERHMEGHKHFRKEYAKGGQSRKMAEHQSLFALKKNGDEFPVEISLSNFKSNDEVHVMVVVSDITKRREAEQKLIKSEYKYRTLFETVVQGIIIQNEKYEVVSANPAVYRIFGAQEGDFDGADHFDPRWRLVHADGSDFPPQSYPVMQVFETGEAIMNVVAGIYCEGADQPVWVNINTFPQFREGEDKPYQVVTTFENITERKEAKDKLETLNVELEKRVEERSRALRESQEMYKMIARNFPNGVINVLDKDLNYILAEGMEMYRLGITSEVLLGTSFISRIGLDIREEVERELMSVFEGKEVNFELNTDGRTYMIYAVGLSGDKEEINQVLMVSQNVTGMKKAEEQTKRTLEKERHLNELKSRFVSMASHEFRTPLTTAMNSLTLLSKYIHMDGKIEKQERHVERINSAIHHLTEILNDFLSIDKLEEGKVTINSSRFDLNEFVEEAIEDMAGLQKEGQQIVHTHTGGGELYADKMMLKNIFNNLLSNAIKYSPEGSAVHLNTTLDTNSFTVVVQDEGIGIPEEDQGHLFERFFRATNATEIQGTGLGLNIIKKYVEMVDGEIDFTSTHGEGTTFTVKLPNKKEN